MCTGPLVEQLLAQRSAALTLAVEWEKEADSGWPNGNLMGYELHEITGEQNACRAHAAELREALGAE